MLYSYEWLKQLTKTKKNPEELSEMIMLKGFELEGREELKEKFKNIVVGEIQEISKHPDADRLQLTKVNVSEKNGGILKIVCGAHNIKVGDKVPVALVGAVIPKNKFKIEKTKIRGEVSCGMLCAEDELGVGKDHSGILILDKEAEVGQSIARILNLEDTILEFDILPDRAHDCLNYQGIAREICAMEGHQLKIGSKKLKIEDKNEKSLNVEIKNKKLCSRYIGVVLDEIKIKPSPKWMQNRLVASGMEPINNIVDITNYVMLEVGNPLHAFDFKNVEGGVTIRTAKKNEELELLDGTKIKLNEKDLIITDSKKAIGLAGIKGGKYSRINNDTTKVILEAANFNQFNIRKTRQRHNLSTEAQLRFEKGISSKLVEDAIKRAVDLFREYANAKLVDYTDKNFSDRKEVIVDLYFEKVDDLLGFESDKKKNIEILKNLGFKIIKSKKDLARIEIPYWRLDINNQEDLIEEIGRIMGYEKIKEKAISTKVFMPRVNQKRKLEWRIKDLLANLGFNEMINYSFYSKKDANFCGLDGEHYEILKPFSEEVEILRKTLLVGLLKNVSLNSSYFDEFNLFELGKVYKVGKYPDEKSKICGAGFSKEKKSDENFYLLKNRAESFLEKITKKEIKFKKIQKETAIFNVDETAEIYIDNKKVGLIGNVENKILSLYKIKGFLTMFEVDFEKVFELLNSNIQFKKFNKYPDARRDLSMFIDFDFKADKIIDIFKKQGGKYFKNAEIFDVFFDKKNNQKSLAFHLNFSSDEKTLTNEEVDKIMQRIIIELEEEKIKVRKN